MKPLGETFAAFIVLYLLALCILLPILVTGMVVYALIAAIECLRGAAPRLLRRPWSFPGQPVLAATLLGAGCAGGANLWLVAREYYAQLARGERYAVATAATALPGMYALTAGYCGILLALFVGGSLIRSVHLARRGT